MATANGTARRGERLKSWKEIAAFFGADERTVRRWEERGLPVRRIPGGGRATIYAEVAELREWMRSRGTSTAVEANAAGSAISANPPSLKLAAFAVIAVAAAALLAFAHPWRSPATHHQPPKRAFELYLAATYDWEKLTPNSLGQARDLFGQAIAEDPAYAEAYAGLANTYLLLREYSALPDSEAYPRAREAAERAISLDPELAEAHAALAFVTFYWTRDWPRALGDFRRAITLDPSSRNGWHWYGTALLHSGRADQALAALEEAQRHDPASRSILADKAFAAYFAGEAAQAVGSLRQLSATEPDFYSPHAYLGQIYFDEANFDASLSEMEIAARLKENAAEIAELTRARQAYRAGGRDAMLRAMLSDELSKWKSGGSSDYQLAALNAELGEKERALQLLAASDRAGEGAFVWVRMDRRFRGLAHDPRFLRLEADAERPPPGRRTSVL